MYSIIYRKISNWNIIIWKLNLPFKFQDLLKYFRYILCFGDMPMVIPGFCNQKSHLVGEPFEY